MASKKITREILLDVASNARLSLSEKEIEKLLPQLEEVLESFSAIDKIDVEGVEPSFQPILLKNVFREDNPGECVSRETALSNTPHKKDGYFKGPKVV